MGRIGILALLAALFAVDAATATPRPIRHHRHHGHARLTRIDYRHSGHLPDRRVHRSGAAAVPVSAPVRRAATEELASRDAGVPEAGRAGWFKAEHEAGWGIDNGGATTVVGLYQRPAQPDIPGPQILHAPEGRGAAGLSLSFKLGQ